MGINQQPSPEQRKMAILSKISYALDSIATNIGYEMGPLKPQKIMTIAEQMKPEWDKLEEARRREQEIKELKRSNKIAIITAGLAVFSSIVVGVASIMIQNSQLKFEKMRYQEEKEAKLIEAFITPSTQSIQATSSTKLNQSTPSSQSTQN